MFLSASRPCNDLCFQKVGYETVIDKLVGANFFLSLSFRRYLNRVVPRILLVFIELCGQTIAANCKGDNLVSQFSLVVEAETHVEVLVEQGCC
jgi:hypothetical protein